MQVRWQVITQLQNGTSQRKVANNHGLSLYAVQSWWRSFKQSGHVNCKPRPGARPTLTGGASKLAVQLLTTSHTTSQAAAALFSSGETEHLVHRTTLARHAKRQAIKEGCPIRAVRGKPQKQLTHLNREQRLAFALACKRVNFKTVMFTDRKKFLFKYPGTAVRPCRWVKKGQASTAMQPNHPQAYNVYGGITAFGTIKLRPVSGTSGLRNDYKNKKGNPSKNIGSMEYQDVVLYSLLPDGTKLFRAHGVTAWTLQQDNDPSHKKAAATALVEFKAKKKVAVKLLKGWPGNSPDLSPIENLWSIIQSRVDARGCKTFAEFKAAVDWEWEHVDKKLLQRLFKSIKARLEACKLNGGERTGY
jgi:hypothetical protein